MPRFFASTRVILSNASNDTNYCAKAKTERGHFKEVNLPFRAVENLAKWLLSVPWAVREQHVVHFEADSAGGSYLQLKDSCERIPIDFVDQKYFRLMLSNDKQQNVSLRQKMSTNLETHIKYAGLSGRILEETKRRGIVRNFEYFSGVKFESTETGLAHNGQKGSFPAEAVWRPKLVGALVRIM
jgi:hypothetical protein